MTLRPQHRCDAGLGAIAVIVALLVAALLSLGYFQMQSAMQPTQAVSTIDTSKAFACKTNRQTVERELQMWLVDHPGETPSLAALAADDGAAAHCPEGGDYTLVGLQVRCSTHE